MNPPRLLVDWFDWRGRHWWERAWLTLTGRGFWRPAGTRCIECGRLFGAHHDGTDRG